MKKYLFIIASVFTFTACENHKAELDNSNRQRDSLMSVLNERDSSIDDFLKSYTDIQENLDSITQRGGTISKDIQNQAELKSTAKERIIEDINAINALMKENREKIAELNKKIKNSSYKNKQLEKMIAVLNEQIALKNGEISALNDQLIAINANVVQLQTSIDTLNTQNASKSQTIAEQTTALHTAYYIVGKSKELEEKKVIDKTGGLLGIGKTSKLNASFDNTHFTKIDYTQVNTVNINNKNAKVVTTHPADSYTLDKDAKEVITALRITNPEKFWSASKYLIVVTK